MDGPLTDTISKSLSFMQMAVVRHQNAGFNIVRMVRSPFILIEFGRANVCLASSSHFFRGTAVRDLLVDLAKWF